MTPVSLDEHMFGSKKSKYELAIVKRVAPTAVKPVANFLKFMDEWTEFAGGWGPHNLFYTTHWETHSYTVHRNTIEHDAFLGVGESTVYKAGDTKSYSTEEEDYTEIGQWFETMPAVVSVVKLPYYVVMWPLTIVLMLMRGIIGMFLPRREKSW